MRQMRCDSHDIDILTAARQRGLDLYRPGWAATWRGPWFHRKRIEALRAANLLAIDVDRDVGTRLHLTREGSAACADYFKTEQGECLR